MKALYAVLVVLATAVTLTSVAAARPAATKQRVQIDINIDPRSTFVLTPLEGGALKRDSGALGGCARWAPDRTVYRDGQETFLDGCLRLAIKGKLGTLVLRNQIDWVEAGGPWNIATGTWKVVRGTGQYAGITGGGRSAEVGNPDKMALARFQGFLTSH